MRPQHPTKRPRAKPRLRGAVAAIVAAVALGVAACGEEDERNRHPAFQPDIGRALAEDAREIGDLFAADDRCGAVERARELEGKIRSLSEDGEIHRKLREPLLSGIDAVMARIQCVVVERIEVPVQPPPPEPEKQEKKPDEDKQGEDKPNGGGGNDRGGGGGLPERFVPPDREPGR